MIGAVENGLIGALRDAGEAGTLGYRYRTLDSYPDEFDAYLKEKGQLRTPAAWAVFLGWSEGADQGDDIGAQFVAQFALVVAAKNLRNETATRHGGVDPTSEPGSYQLAEDAVRVLSQSDLGLPLVAPIEFTGGRLVARSAEVRTQGLSLFALTLRCTVPLGQFEGAGNPADFTAFHADWDVPAFGDVTLNAEAPFLPAADPDAEDLLELPQ